MGLADDQVDEVGMLAYDRGEGAEGVFEALAGADQTEGAHHPAATEAEALLDGFPRFAGSGRRAVVNEAQLPHRDAVLAVQDLFGDRVHDDHPPGVLGQRGNHLPHPRLRIGQHGVEGGEERLAQRPQEAIEAAAFEPAVHPEFMLKTHHAGGRVVEELGRGLVLLLASIIHDVNHGPRVLVIARAALHGDHQRRWRPRAWPGGRLRRRWQGRIPAAGRCLDRLPAAREHGRGRRAFSASPRSG